MKVGKVSQTVLKRSMLKPLQYHREESLFSPSVEEMCYGIRCGRDEQVITTEAVLYGNEKDLAVFAMAQAGNQLASRGAKCVGAAIHIMLPTYAYESRLKAMMEYAEETAAEHSIQILSAKAEVSPVIQSTIVHLTGLGICKKEALMRSSEAKAGQDLVLLGYVGLEGTHRILKEKEEELSKRFVEDFFRPLKETRPMLFAEKALENIGVYEISAMHPIGAGGILAALWELCEAADMGMEIELKKMNIRQETVEICEFFHLNPYQLTSTGSMLIVTDKGEALVESLQEKGIAASILGRTTKEKARVILGGEEKRFLDRPAPDELIRIYDSI